MTTDFATQRVNMLESQVRTHDVTDLALQDAIAVAPREKFCPPGKEHLAYAETEIEYCHGWRLMEPRDLAKLLQSVAPVAGEKALCIAGPYAAMVLSRMGVVTTLRQAAGIACATAETALADEKVIVTAGDLVSLGVETEYDVIVAEGAVTKAPDAWLKALKVGGRLGVVERTGPVGKAVVYLKTHDGVTGRAEMFDSTPHQMPGFEPKPAFVF